MRKSDFIQGTKGLVSQVSANLLSLSRSKQEVLKQYLQGEEIPLDVQGVKDCVLRIGRVGQDIKELGNGADICVRCVRLSVNVMEPNFQCFSGNDPGQWRTYWVHAHSYVHLLPSISPSHSKHSRQGQYVDGLVSSRTSHPVGHLYQYR